MKRASKRFTIYLVGINQSQRDEYRLDFQIGTMETNWALEKMGIGFNSYQSVDYYAQKEKLIDFNEITLPYSREKVNKPYLKGLVYWACKMDRDRRRDEFFDSSKYKQSAIDLGGGYYSDVKIMIRC